MKVGIVRVASKAGRGVAGDKYPKVENFTTIDATSGSMNKVAGFILFISFMNLSID